MQGRFPVRRYGGAQQQRSRSTCARKVAGEVPGVHEHQHKRQREKNQRLNRELNAILAQALTRELVASTGSVVGGGTPEAFGALIRSETEKWAKVVRQAGIRPE